MYTILVSDRMAGMLAHLEKLITGIWKARQMGKQGNH